MNSAWSGVGTEKVPHLSLPLAICLLHAAPSAVLPKPDMCLKASHLSSANEQENVTAHYLSLFTDVRKILRNTFRYFLSEAPKHVLWGKTTLQWRERMYLELLLLSEILGKRF